ncbi:hypothetical protein PIB30_102163 [Stylosanthes scabra]|uniref:Ubiquitin-like protease family profile domain-containing protein n=1 Tax=Stylosanthes scabra TaxID=79078 RepID=A0ABU6SY20_9FABA|nr:hypothetical protein [Stylosanthes scabra]
MAEGAEMDLAIVQIMCILYNRKNNEKFNYTTYCVPPLFLSNVLDQMRVRAGAETMFFRMTKNMVTHSLFPKYIRVPKQPNAFDCGVYVLKYMDIVNPSLLEKKNFTVLVWTEDELQSFREEFVERILYDGYNYYRHQAIKASNATARHPRPSTALQNPYTQLQLADLESEKLE